MANYANKKEFRKALLYALGVEKSLAEVDTEEFREGILQGLNASYTIEDLKVRDKFRAKLVAAVAEAMAEGGDSDFSTAEVTFVCETTGFEQPFLGAWTYDDGEESSIYNHLPAPESSPATATVVLYKGKTVISPGNNKVIEAMTATGDAEVDSKNFDVYITGDCTITYSVE